jgi:Reverse transcriptase (RNA-dependent DNA polymerase)
MINDKEDIYSGVFQMYTLRIGFSLGEVNGISCWICDIVNAFLYGKTKVKVYISAGSEFEIDLHGKNLIIDKSLYGLKASAARFHDHVDVSLLRLGFKEKKYDPDLWMIEKSSHYEYSTTYLDEILISSKDPMVIREDLHIKWCRHSRLLFI